VFCFVQPLYVPKDHLWFNFGDRLRDLETNRDWWEVPETNPEAVMRAIAEAIRVRGGQSVNRFRARGTVFDTFAVSAVLRSPDDAAPAFAEA